MKNKKILYLYTGDHPVHRKFANCIEADIEKMSWKISKNYDVYFCEGEFFRPVILKMFGNLKKSSKIIGLFSDPRLFYLDNKIKFNKQKQKIEKASRIKIDLFKRATNLIDGAICVAGLEEELLKKFYSGPIKKVDVFIDEKFNESLLKEKPDLKENKILFIGNGIDPYYKGIDLLINVARKNKDLNFTIVGYEFEQFLETNKKIIPNNVCFTGGLKMNSPELKEIIKNSSLYLHLGRGEAFGITILEAMAAGLPCIVSEKTGAREAVEKINPNHVVPLDVGKVSKVIKEYFKKNQEQRKIISDKFREVSKIYNEKDQLKNFKNKFNQLLLNIFDKRILILRTEQIGDYGLSLAGIKMIRKKYPNARIDVVVGPWNKDFAKVTPYIDNYYLFDNPLVKRNIKYKDFAIVAMKNTKKMMSFANKINKNKYDLLISFSDRAFNKIFLKLFKAKKKISGHNWPDSEIDDVSRMLNLMKSHNFGEKFEDVKLNYSKEDKKIVKKIMQKAKNLILIHPITYEEEKNWGEENWKKLIELILQEEKNSKIFLIGTNDQKNPLKRIIPPKFQEKIINGGGMLTIPQLILLISKSRIIIGIDSGPVHLARLTKTKIISLLRNSNAKLWSIPEDKGISIKAEKIKDIKVEDVFLELKKV